MVSRILTDLDSLPLSPPGSENDEATIPSVTESPLTGKKDLRFWLIFTSMCICLFLSALELSSISTALPTIAHDLRATQYVWVGSAYALASTAFLPLSGGLAQTFGRRPAILIAISLFTIGSGICGGASSMIMLVAGRTVQGLGGGGIQSLTGIIVADLVTLQERGVYNGLFGLAWCLASLVGPVVGGSLASHGRWRWVFYLNLPLSLIAFLSVVLFLDVPVPPGKYWNKLRQMDWMGNLVVVASTVACTIGLTWGGTTAPWGSAAVLVPLLTGVIGLLVFVAYEASIAEHPLVPLKLMTNATSISGYIQSFCIAVNTMGVVYFFPVYFQACKGLSPTQSGIYTLALCTFAPASIIAGVSVRATGRYRLQMWAAWVIVLVAMGLLSRMGTTGLGLGIGASVGYLILLGLGTGVLYAAAIYPIQAPLSVTQNAPALAWLWFLRSFAGVLGITMGSTILQNQLAKMLPASVIPAQPAFQQEPHSIPSTNLYMYLYALIPELSTLPPHMRSEVQTAFAHSLTALWRVLAVVCVIGCVASLFMQGYELEHALDANWVTERGKGDEEKGGDKESALERASDIRRVGTREELSSISV